MAFFLVAANIIYAKNDPKAEVWQIKFHFLLKLTATLQQTAEPEECREQAEALGEHLICMSHQVISRGREHHG